MSAAATTIARSPRSRNNSRSPARNGSPSGTWPRIEPDSTGAVNPPVYQSSTFAFRDAAHGARLFTGEEQGYIYTRIGNPTIRALEDNIAALEGGARGMACSSGMAASNTLFFSLLSAGDHVIITDAVYGPTRLILETHWSRFGVEHSAVDTADLDAVAAAVRPNTRMLFIETPANPTLKITDIAGCAAIAHGAGAVFVVDNTFMSPVLQRPLEHGADIVVHSITKFINGHTDIVGGLIVFKEAAGYQLAFKPWYMLGAVMDPHQAFLGYRGVKSLKLRVLAAQANAERLARALVEHPAVAWVANPGLPEHPQSELHRRQASGPGALISFELKGGLTAGEKLMNGVAVMTLAVSLGGIETLIQHPASMTHAGMTPAQRMEAGITDGLVRLSVGCEDVEDLLADLDQALARV
jgi:methionine-gamma-lyase